MPRTLSEREFNAIKDQVLKSLPEGWTEAEFNRQIGPRMEHAIGTAENIMPWHKEWPKLASFIKGATDVFPMIGGMLGGAAGTVAAPETFGASILGGAALGAGAGAGARDVTNEFLGLSEPTTPLEKAQSIANTISLGAVLPMAADKAKAAWQALRQIGGDVGPIIQNPAVRQAATKLVTPKSIKRLQELRELAQSMRQASRPPAPVMPAPIADAPVVPPVEPMAPPPPPVMSKHPLSMNRPYPPEGLAMPKRPLSVKPTVAETPGEVSAPESHWTPPPPDQAQSFGEAIARANQPAHQPTSTNPAAELANQLGLKNDAEVFADMAHRAGRQKSLVPKYGGREAIPVRETQKSAADWAREMADLRRVKPRPIDKLFGQKGPTPDQLARWTEDMKAWNRAYRKASQMQKLTLAMESKGD